MINFQFIEKLSLFPLSCLLILSSTLVIEYVLIFHHVNYVYQRIPYGRFIVGLILYF